MTVSIRNIFQNIKKYKNLLEQISDVSKENFLIDEHSNQITIFPSVIELVTLSDQYQYYW